MAKRRPKKPAEPPDDNEALPNLTEKQLRFVDEYVKNGGNATLAYHSAGYKKSKNSRNFAYELKQNPYIRAIIRERIEHLRTLTKVDEAFIIRRLSAHAATTLKDVQLENSYFGRTLKSWDTITDDQAMAIKKHSVTSGENASESVEMQDPIRSIELLVKYLNYFPNAQGNKNAEIGRELAAKAQESAADRIRDRLARTDRDRDDRASQEGGGEMPSDPSSGG